MKCLPLAVALLVAVGGGIYFGLFSCGGYAWQRPAFYAVLVLLTLTALLVPLRRGRPIMSRLGTVLGVGVAFLFTEAVSASLYPGLPASMAEFMRLFLHALRQGPC